ncbi:X-box-binding protein 1 [Ahaetulla prasina]|uniref:X-box-binding protein 1 n=1 Tax=Ahaetulla prasina TaxID=499056 RepID=UPI00264A3718|nr:X-box-binding protein 1 [Ahaetulla prasina]
MAPLPSPAVPPPPRLLLLPAASTAAPGAPSPSPPPRKRQRLAHLSPEEKALRRKLKNRVAAQSARDRKKARMGELERQAVELEAENQKLLAENRRLRERAHSLARENHDLRLRLGLPTLKVEMQEETASIAPGGAETGSSESAALRLRVPPQKGQAQQSSASTVGERRRRKRMMGASLWAQTAWLLQMLSLISSWAFWIVWIQTCSCTVAAPRQFSLRSCSRKCAEKHLFPYLPPPVPPWGLHHSGKMPLMN